jgi:3-phenylpropionate/trans-cinnamate dioxygenase ferredoxin subunit
MSSEASEWLPVCDTVALRLAGKLERMVGQQAILLLWTNDRVHVVDAFCPHAAAPLAEGYVADGRLHCPGHRASFDLATGVVNAGWRTEPLAIHEARDVDGIIHVRLRASCTATKNAGSFVDISRTKA